MDIRADDTESLRLRIYAAVKKAGDGSGMVIHTSDGERHPVRSDVFLGSDCIEFRSGGPGRMIVPFDKIVKVMVG